MSFLGSDYTSSAQSNFANPEPKGVDASKWSKYPAEQEVDLAGNDMINVNNITANNIVANEKNVNNLTVTNDASIGGNTTMNGGLLTLGQVQLFDTLFVNNATAIGGNITANSNISVAENAFIDGGAFIGGTSFTHDIDATGDISVSNNITVSNSLDVAEDIFCERIHVPRTAGGEGLGYFGSGIVLGTNGVANGAISSASGMISYFSGDSGEVRFGKNSFRAGATIEWDGSGGSAGENGRLILRSTGGTIIHDLTPTSASFDTNVNVGGNIVVEDGNYIRLTNSGTTGGSDLNSKETQATTGVSQPILKNDNTVGATLFMNKAQPISNSFTTDATANLYNISGNRSFYLDTPGGTLDINVYENQDDNGNVNNTIPEHLITFYKGGGSWDIRINLLASGGSASSNNFIFMDMSSGSIGSRGLANTTTFGTPQTFHSVIIASCGDGSATGNVLYYVEYK